MVLSGAVDFSGMIDSEPNSRSGGLLASYDSEDEDEGKSTL